MALVFDINPAIEAPQLLAIAREAYQQYVAAIGKEPAPMVADYAAHIENDTILTASQEGAVIAFAIIIEKQDGFWLETIAVADGYRGQGVGTALLGQVERFISTKASAYQLYTNEKMTSNKSWYLALGFVLTQVKTQDGYRRIFFKKEL